MKTRGERIGNLLILGGFLLIAISIFRAVISNAQIIGGGAGGGGAATVGWLQFLGDNSEGAITCSGNVVSGGGEHWVSSFTVANGTTCTVNAANNPLVIRSTGTCTIAGTLNARGTDGGSSGQGDFGGSGGGGGGGTAAGVAGSASTAGGSATLALSGAAGTSSGGTGGNGNTVAAQKQRLALSGLPYPRGGGPGGAGGSTGGAGGPGGQVIVLDCAIIDFQATGVIDVSGANGTASPGNNQGGGGGGGAGYVIIAARSYVNNSGTITTAGGTGGSCGAFTGCGAGGTGGAGWSKTF